MVVVSAPVVDKICESFTHNPMTRSQGNPTFNSLVGSHKECIANTSKFECNFGGWKYVYACVAMGYQQYILHSSIGFLYPRKPGLTMVYPLNPTQSYITVADRQYQNNVYNYHLVKNMNSSLKKIDVTDIDEQWIKG